MQRQIFLTLRKLGGKIRRTFPIFSPAAAWIATRVLKHVQLTPPRAPTILRTTGRTTTMRGVAALVRNLYRTPSLLVSAPACCAAGRHFRRQR